MARTRRLTCPEPGCHAVMTVPSADAASTEVLHLGPGQHQALTLHDAARTKHNPDGSQSVTSVTPPKTRTDPRPRGRRRG